MEAGTEESHLRFLLRKQIALCSHTHTEIVQFASKLGFPFRNMEFLLGQSSLSSRCVTSRLKLSKMHVWSTAGEKLSQVSASPSLRLETQALPTREGGC